MVTAAAALKNQIIRFRDAIVILKTRAIWLPVATVVLQINPALYIKHMRLETAKYDLLYTDHSIAFIADTIGFSTIQKLSKDFKEYTGFTPTEFRKTFK